MLKVSNRFSTTLSVIVAVIFILAFAVCAAVLPFVWKDIPFIADLVTNLSSEGVKQTPFFIWLYLNIAVAEACCVAVLFILFRVRKGKVFTDITVSLIRFVSWGCVLLTASLLIGIYFHPLMLLLAVAMAFFGLCQRVVKNVIEEATHIKNENDLTV